MITINVKNSPKTGAKRFVLLRANCCTDCYYNFNPCGIFENMTPFTPILEKELEQVQVNGGAKFSEIKVQKTRVVMFVTS